MAMPRRSTILTIAAAVALVALSSASSAVATRMITGADIQDRTITGSDIKAGTLKLEHLDRTSIRAGHVHHSRDAVVVGRGATKTKVVRDSNKGLAMANGVMTRLAAVTSLPAGTYTVMASGVLSSIPVYQSSKYYPATEWCTINALGTQVAMEMFGSSPNAAMSFTPTVAMSRVVTLTSPGDIAIACEIMVTSPSPINNVIGFGDVDLVAFPASSASAG